MPLRWFFVDMNAYFASVEQQERPELRGRPIVVAPVKTDSTCCIAASYEAKRFGIKTGTAIWEARRMCPQLIVVEARPPLYVQYHHQIMEIIEKHLHVDKILSIDEMACRLPSNESSVERATAIAQRLKEAMDRELGTAIRCSVGIAPNRFLAKVASDMQKPNGLTVLQSEELPGKLFRLSLQDLPGVGRNMYVRLCASGIDTVEAMWKTSPDRLARAWGGVMGRDFWHMLHGDNPPEVPTSRRTVGHSHVLPPELRTPAGARGVLIRLVHKAAARLRHLGYAARQMSLSVSYTNHSWWGDHLAMGYCQDTLNMLEALERLWARRRAGDPKKVGITLFDLDLKSNVSDSLFPEEQRRLRLARAMDGVNDRYGNQMVYFADMYSSRDTAPTRIAFTSIPTEDSW